MIYLKDYDSPMCRILLACDDEGLTGLWLYGGREFPANLEGSRANPEHPTLKMAEQWLDVYFSGQAPDFTPPLHIEGTDFQRKVWNVLLTIPYGHTVTYGEISRKVSSSPRAVGGVAVSKNRVSIIIPCHRVIGHDGSLKGYVGGLERKAWLLRHEGAAFKPSSQELHPHHTLQGSISQE